MKLIIANRNYSSWSLRPWLVLTHFGIPFEERLLRFDEPGYESEFRRNSPSGRVPVLLDGDLAIPESIAIIEYLADRFPEHAIWPRDVAERAWARSVSAEMHGGFGALRQHAPMNLRASHPGRVPLDVVAADIGRVEALWGECIARSGGPYLFGAFTAADAMFAPMATRLRTYDLPVSDVAAGYVEAIYALPAFRAWLAEALKEPWVADMDEIDVIQGRAR